MFLRWLTRLDNAGRRGDARWDAWFDRWLARWVWPVVDIVLDYLPLWMILAVWVLWLCA